MQEQDQTAQVLIELQGIKVFRIVNGQSSQVCEGAMRIGCISTQNVYFLNVADFYYTLQKQINFTVISFPTQRTFIFPHIDQGFSAIIVPIAYEQNAELDTILKTTVTLLDEQSAKLNQQLKQDIDSHAPEVWSKPLIEDSQLIHYIQKGGGMLKTGFTMLGGMMAMGVNKGGEWLDSKVKTDNSQKQVDQSTKTKVETVKEKTKSTMQVAGFYLNKVFTPVANYTNQVIDNVSTSIDQGNNQNLKKLKEVTKVTGQSVNTAFQGLSTGASQVGSAVSQNTTHLVNKKYGEDYSKTFLGADGQKNQDQQQQQQQQQQQPQQQQQKDNNGSYPNLNDESQQNLL